MLRWPAASSPGSILSTHLLRARFPRSRCPAECAPAHLLEHASNDFPARSFAVVANSDMLRVYLALPARSRSVRTRYSPRRSLPAPSPSCPQLPEIAPPKKALDTTGKTPPRNRAFVRSLCAPSAPLHRANPSRTAPTPGSLVHPAGPTEGLLRGPTRFARVPPRFRRGCNCNKTWHKRSRTRHTPEQNLGPWPLRSRTFAARIPGPAVSAAGRSVFHVSTSRRPANSLLASLPALLIPAAKA